MAAVERRQRPKVTAREHNAVMEAAQKRVDGLEPRLAEIIEGILARAGAKAASRFQEKALRHFGASASLTAAAAWTAPFPDELIDVDALVKQILAKTDPVRKAMIEQTMTPALEQAGLSWDVSNPLTAQMLAVSASQVTNIAMTTRANLMKIIGSAYQNGLTVPQTAGLIRDGMAAASKTRSVMIARTELARAVNGGSLAATQLVSSVTGQKYDKVWKVTPGARYPRHELDPTLDDQTVPMDQTFTVGDSQLQFPGDPNGEPGDTINCRCTLIYQEVQADRVPQGPPTNDEVTAQAAGEEVAAPQIVFPTVAPEVVTASVEKAAKALADGKTVQLTQTSTVNTFIDRLGKMAADAQRAGKSAPNLDLGKVSVKGTNLFTQDSLGIPRVEMPQLEGLPVPGSPASKLPTTMFEGKPSPWVDISDSFFKSLEDQGVQVTQEEINPESLKATQSQLNGPKVARMMDDLEAGTPIPENIVVSSDNYILDGHHHWAAQIGQDYKTGIDVPHPMTVTRVDEPITTLLQQAHDYAEQMGIPPQGAFHAAPVETAVPAVEKAPVPTPSVPVDFKQQVDIGITPFRADEDNAVGFYDSAKYQQFVRDLNESADAYGVHIDGIDHVTGVWEGDTEPSVSLHVSAETVQHSTPPPIDFRAPVFSTSPPGTVAGVTDKQQAEIEKAVADAYRRMDTAGLRQDWMTAQGWPGQPTKIEAHHYGVNEAALQLRGDTIDINVDSKLYPASTYQADATSIAKGDVPHFINSDMADAIIHEYGHAVYQSLDQAQRAEWTKFWQSWPTPGTPVGYPSFYAQETAQEAWSETFVALVRGYSQGDKFQVEMRSLLSDKVLATPDTESTAYRIQHTAPDALTGSPMNDLTANGTYPKDVYKQKTQMQLYGTPRSVPAHRLSPDEPTIEEMEQEAFNVVNGVHGDPTATVTVYRAAPGNVDTINPGDWVTPSKAYANVNAEAPGLAPEEKAHVISMQVPAGQLYTDGNSIVEWGWQPPDRAAIDAAARFRAYAANLGRAYNQDGVLLFTPTSEGADSMMVTFKATYPQNVATDAMKKAGVSGGRFTTDGRLQVIGPLDAKFAEQITELARGLGGLQPIGTPLNFDSALHHYTGPGSTFFKDAPSFLKKAESSEQLRVILEGEAGDVSKAFDNVAVSGADQNRAITAITQATQASLENRGLPDTLIVYRQGKIDPTGVESFSLKPNTSTFKNQQAYQVARKDILVDTNAFFPNAFANENEVLIRGNAVKSVPMPKEVKAEYDVQRGVFDLMEREAGDYQKALDEFAHPQGVTATITSAKKAAPDAKLMRGDPITGWPTTHTQATVEKIKALNDKLPNEAQNDWIDKITTSRFNREPGAALGIDTSKLNMSPDEIIRGYTSEGAHDINGVLSGEITNSNPWDLNQYRNIPEVKDAAAAMRQIVDSAPPLPEGTTLYRGVNPIGIDPTLRDVGNAASRKILGPLEEKWGIDKLDPYSFKYGEIWRDPEFQKEHKKAVKQAWDAVTKVIGNWATDRYPVGSYVAMGKPGEFESLTANPSIAANFGPSSEAQPSLVFRVLNAKTGAPVYPFSAFPAESEVLAPPGTMYRVRSVELRKMDLNQPMWGGRTGDKVVVNLEEVSPLADRPPDSLAAQYVPDGIDPPTVGSGDLFPGQGEAVGAHAALTRDQAIVRYAAANGMTPEDYKSAADEIVKSYVSAHPQIRIRVTHDTLEQIVADGRFKSEFELPGVTPDMVESRAYAEKNLFGYNTNLDPAQRPIYGYLAGTADERGLVTEYGDMLVNIDPAVNTRATFTIGDSFRAGIHGDLSPSLLSNPGIGSWDASFDIVKAYREGNIEAITKYVEVEVHDGLAASEIGGVDPDYALIRAREEADRVREAVETVTELAANYEGTQLETPQTQQEAGVPTDKPASLDFAGALRDLAKNSTHRQDAIRALLSDVGLRLHEVNNLAAVDELLAKVTI